MAILTPGSLKSFDLWKQAVIKLLRLAAENRSYLDSPWTNFDIMAYNGLHKGRHPKSKMEQYPKLGGFEKQKRNIQISIWQFWKNTGCLNFSIFLNQKENLRPHTEKKETSYFGPFYVYIYVYISQPFKMSVRGDLLTSICSQFQKCLNLTHSIS